MINSTDDQQQYSTSTQKNETDSDSSDSFSNHKKHLTRIESNDGNEQQAPQQNSIHIVLIIIGIVYCLIALDMFMIRFYPHYYCCYDVKMNNDGAPLNI